MTEMTTMGSITPKATPTTQISVMTETNVR